MNTQPFFDEPDGDTYRDGQDILDPQRNEQLTDDIVSDQGPYKSRVMTSGAY